MQKKLSLLLILMLLPIGLAVPTQPAAAEGADHVYFNATSFDLCMAGYPDERCQYGTPRPLPNGKMFLSGWVSVVQFTAEDPRWTAECIFTGDTFPPGNAYTFPLMGSFVCTPYDPALQGGWWEGSLSQVGNANKWNSVFTATGYGDFTGLKTISRNGKPFINPDASFVMEIITLPGYQK